MVAARSLGYACILALMGNHLAAADGLSRSPNFVVLAPDQQTADQLLEQAEACRQQVAVYWLGRQLPDGVGRTLVHFSHTSSDASGGFLPLDDSGRQLHRIRVAAMPGYCHHQTLAHEVTHLVMEVWFSGQLPAWANEGAAMFQDGQHLAAVRAKWIQHYAHSGRWPRLKQVLESEQIRDDIEAYAMADFFTRYLLTLDSADTFFQFAVQGNRVGWENAANQHYGRSLAQLQKDWQAWASHVVSGTELAATIISSPDASNASMN